MPFTPFHFGLGILIKGLAPRHFGLAAFAATQVAIDVETLVHMLRGEWPWHRQLHSYVGATAMGIVVGLSVFGVARAVTRFLPRSERVTRGPARQMVECCFVPSLIGGIIGGASHTLLDAIMHEDVQPFWPFSPANGLLRLVSVAGLHFGCVAAAALGIALLLVRRPPPDAERD
jgi:hypothetical protein